jgi:diguanylate cyclase (GGDEF)-like protein
MLLGLVFGVVLVLVGVTASALAAIASEHLSRVALADAVTRDASLIERFVNEHLTPADVAPAGPGEERVDELAGLLGGLVRSDDILRIEIRGRDGRVLASNEAGLAGLASAQSPSMTAALGGTPTAGLVEAADGLETVGSPLDAGSVLQEFLPILDDDGQAHAVIVVWRDAAALVGSMEGTRRDVMLITLAAGALLAILLFFVFRAAQVRLARQHDQLVEAGRRDALTDLLNHGAVVFLLADEIEAARSAGGRIGVALVDVDNFRLFNETHGHEAADEVLLRVAELVARLNPDGRVARYGPDEFLILRTGAGVDEMLAASDELRAGLGELTVQFGESERLPVSASIGICAYPDHGSSVTEVLSAAAVAVGEAKAGGGDSVCVARIGEEERVAVGGFDVLRGLVIAVDAKDRYTKRHSEDVARYAVFLGERLGLDEEMLRTIHLAGLLHDVGKIGIPDVVLRKPSKLTADEYGMFQQHVALGDAIVRDVPNVDVVRAGIRHHHERWDGKGYLEGLEGEAIPLIGRVLAVADAFSAMTTTRPYRKALPIEEALKRLEDAAGTQLQEFLVTAFITGIETAPDAPLPGDESPRIWTPQAKVA